jgi:hypothetical protein
LKGLADIMADDPGFATEAFTSYTSLDCRLADVQEEANHGSR